MAVPRRSASPSCLGSAPPRARIRAAVVSGVALSVLAISTGAVQATTAQPAAASSVSIETLQQSRVDNVDRSAGRPALVPLVDSTIDVADTDAQAAAALAAQAEQAAAAQALAAQAEAQKAAETAAVAAAAQVVTTMYTTAALNLRSSASASSALLTVVAVGSSVKASATDGDWRQITAGSATGWVKASYLSAEAPVAASTTPTKAATAPVSKPASAAPVSSSSACASGSGMESGLTSRAITLHRALCAAFPNIGSYGGARADGEHSSGRAIDAMISGAAGRAVANWLRANASSLGVVEVIYEQKIWTTQRAGEGWRSMSDRGGTTANHYDHVHVKVG